MQVQLEDSDTVAEQVQECAYRFSLCVLTQLQHGWTKTVAGEDVPFKHLLFREDGGRQTRKHESQVGSNGGHPD